MNPCLPVLLFSLAAVSSAAGEPATGREGREARLFVERWVAAQNTGDFEAYKALYAPSFSGVRRSGQKKVDLDRDGWLKDRARMFKKKVVVTVGPVEVERVGSKLRARFTQRWESGSYADTGIKLLDLEVGPKGLWLTREELLESIVDQVSPGDVAPIRSWLTAHEAKVRREDPTARFRLVSVRYFDNNNWELGADGAEMASHVFVEGKVEGATCRTSLRKLDLDWPAEAKPPILPKVGNELVMAEDCCKDQPCPQRPPGGWLLALRDACAQARWDVVARFIDPKAGVEVSETYDGGRDEPDQVSKRKIRKGQASKLCQILLVPFECPPAFEGESAQCSAPRRGESWSYWLVKRPEGVFIDRAAFHVQN
jgi:hypothetical protein